MKIQSDGLHEIKNKKRPRVVRKKGRVLLSAKHMSRAAKAVAACSGAAVITLGAFGINALFRKESALPVDLGYGSSMYEVLDGETFSMDAGYSADDIFGRLNWKFRNQTNWYAEVHGNVDTIAKQDVRTYKQFDNGILISADVTKSSMVNAARQFCYIEDIDRVVWREAAGGPDTYDGMNTPWSTGEPTANMHINYHEDANNNGKLDEGEDANGNGKLDVGFKATCGLPAYELSVYVIRETGEDDTILDSSVEDNGDGTFTLRLDLDPNLYLGEDGVYRGATMYYANQMIFTGGLTAAPTFKEIHASFTFNENFEVQYTTIEEAYTATLGVSVGCTASSRTDYEYNTEKAKSDAYETYFKQYMEREADSGPFERELTATECLAQAFGPIMSGPCELDLTLNLDGKPVDGTVYLDLNMENGLNIDNIEARGRFGSVGFWLHGGVVRLEADHLKISLGLDEVMGLFSSPAPAAETEGADTTDLLAQLAGGTYAMNKEEGTASLTSTIVLLQDGENPERKFEIPLGFYFRVDENNAVSLDRVETQIAFSDYPVEQLEGMTVGATVTFGSVESAPAALTPEQEAEFVELAPYVADIMDLAGADAFRADLSYEGDGFAVTAQADIALAGGVTAAGNITVSVLGAEKSVGFVFAGSAAYLDLDGIKLSATLDEAIALISKYAGSGSAPEVEFSVRALLSDLLEGKVTEQIEAIREEDGMLSVAVHGTELLELFGLNFDLGDVTLGVKDGTVHANVLGISVALSGGQTPAVPELSGYVGVASYADTLIGLFTGGALGVTLDADIEGFRAEGDLALTLSPFALAGTVDLTYAGKTKTVNVQFTDGEVGLALGSLKFRANAEEAVALLSQYLSVPEENGDAGETADLLGRVLGLTFGDYISLAETEDALEATVRGTELLHALGIEHALGDVILTVGDSLEVEVPDLLHIAIARGEAPVPEDTGDYLDILPYAETLAELFTGDAVALDLGYENADLGLKVEGDITLNLSPIAAKGDIRIVYGSIDRTVSVQYADDTVYLTLGEVKLCADVHEAVAILTQYLGLPEGGETGDILATVFGLDFDAVLSATEAEGALELTLRGNELLAALGADFRLGDVKIGVQEGKVTAEAPDLGVRAEIASSEPFTAETEGYIDLTPFVQEIPSVLEDKGISFTGALSISAGDTTVALDVHEGHISWKDGIALYLDATLSVAGSEHDIALSVDSERVRFAYGNVGAEIILSDLSTLQEAFDALAARIDGLAEQAMQDGTAESIGLVSLSELFSGASVLAETADSFDWTGLVQEIAFERSEIPGGLLRVIFGGLSVDLLGELEEGGLLGLALTYYSDSIRIEGELHAAAQAEAPEFPVDCTLTAETFADLLDYVGAAAELVACENITLGIEGTVRSSEDKYRTEDPATDGVKYAVSGTVNYYSGGGFPFTVSENGVVINEMMYLRASVAVEAKHADDRGLYLDIYVANTSLDGSLDIYVTVSAYAKDSENYHPLSFHVPADEIMTLLSGAFTAFGVQSDLLDRILILNWLPELETRAQLEALGSSLKSMIASLVGIDLEGIFGTVNGALGVIEGLFENNSSEEPAAIALSLDRARKGFLKSVTAGENTFTFSLDGQAMGGMGEDPVVTLGKKTVEGKSVLTLLSVANIVSGGESVSLALTIDPENSVIDRNDIPVVKYDFVGFDTLLLALAKSATHPVDGEVISGEETAHEYALNSNFYINGNVVLDASIVKVNVRLIAVSVSLDEAGKVAINLRLEYDGVQELNQIAINGDSQVDVTIKDGMIYMKRTQTSMWSKNTLISYTEKELENPIVLYRVTTLENFGRDILDHVKFLFNFGSLINDLLPSGDSGSGDGGEPAPAAPAPDFGAQVEQYISAYSFAAGGEEKGDSWTVTVNGGALADGILGDITVAISSDTEGYIRSLDVSTKLVSVITATAEFKWRNPGGVMDPGVKDQTNDIAEQLGRDMNRALADPDWDSVSFYEGEYGVVYFRVGDEIVGSQNVVFGTGDRQGELYTVLKFPSLEKYMDTNPGTAPVWPEVDRIEGSGQTISATFVPNEYTLVFESDRPFDGAEEKDGKWTMTIENYVYGSDVALPQGRNEETFLDYWYYDHGGKTYTFTSIRDRWGYFPASGEPVVFTAHWAYVDYTVSFTADGRNVQRDTNRHFGDTVTAPEAPEKVGYEFVEWQADGRSVSAGNPVEVNGDLAFVAVYRALTFDITLVSDHDIEWSGMEFVLSDEAPYEGKYVARLTYTYGTAVTLPSELRIDIDGTRYFLDGFVPEGEENFVTSLSGVLEDTVLTARWTEVGAAVRFKVRASDSADGSEQLVATRNYAAGSALTNLPEVPEKRGYTGAWDVAKDFVVSESEEGYDVYAKYTPVTYYFTAFSAREITGAGWTRHDPTADNNNLFWQWTFSYVYGSDRLTDVTTGKTFACNDIGSGVKAAGYDFGGFWTMPRAGGERVFEISEATVKLFGYNVGNKGGTNMALDGRNILYAQWIDNTVTAKLYSDFDFTGSEGREGVLYYRTISRNDANYDIGVTLESKHAGYEQLGWWYFDPETGVPRAVTSLAEFYDRETGTVTEPELYAVWMEDLTISVTSLSEASGLPHQVTIEGSVSNGNIVGTKSAEIAAAAGMERTLTGNYIVFRSATNGTSDLTNDITFNGTQFASGQMRFGNGIPWGGATYGGAEICTVFRTAAGEEFRIGFASAVTFEEYTVTYRGAYKDGATQDVEVKLRLKSPHYRNDKGYPVIHDYEEYTARSLAERKFIGIEAAEGHNRSWPETPVTGNMTVEYNDVLQVYNVVFRSSFEIAGFDRATEGTYAGSWIKRAYMEYGASVEFLGFGGARLEENCTVIGAAQWDEETGEYREIIIDVPEVPALDGGKTGSWAEPIVTMSGAAFNAEYPFDTVVYHSEVAFEGLQPDGTLTVQYAEKYSVIEPTAEGYTFLGWFVRGDGWDRAPAELEVSTGEPVRYELEALWMKNATLTVSGNRETRNLVFVKYYKHVIQATLTGGELIGAPKEAVTVSETIDYVVNDSEDPAENAVYTNSETFDAFTSARSWTSPEGGNGVTHAYGHAKVSVVYTYRGETIASFELAGFKKY